jgi:hypothetical protein
VRFSIPAQQKLVSAVREGAGIAVVQEFVDVETARRSAALASAR